MIPLLLSSPLVAMANPVVELYPTGPYGKPMAALFPGDIHAASVTENPRLDGVFDEEGWQRAPRAPGPRPIGVEPPPSPSWSVRVLVAPAGLVVGIQGVPPETTGGLSIDRDHTRRGWTLVEFGPTSFTQSDCYFRHEDASMPFPDQWSVHVPRCSTPARGAGTRGPDGWEILVPWSTLAPATDDLRLHAWARSPGYSASWDPGGAAAGYGQGRLVVVDGKPERGDALTIRYRRGDSRIDVTLAGRGLSGPERWIIEAWRAGALIESHPAQIDPRTPSATVAVREPEWTGLNFVARREGSDPLGPGARTYPWLVNHVAGVATPVVEDALEVRFNLSTPEEVALELGSLDGTIIANHPIKLPSGVGRVWLAREPSWPTHLQVRLGDLLPGGTVPVLVAPLGGDKQ